MSTMMIPPELPFQSLDVLLDLSARRLHGTTTLSTVVPHAGDVFVHFQGPAGSVERVSLNGHPCTHKLFHPLRACLAASPPSLGLEGVNGAAVLAGDVLSRGELCVAVPAGVTRGTPAVLEVVYSLVGDSGPLVWALDGSEPYCVVAQNAWRACEDAALGGGARCVFPCVDTLGDRRRFTLRLSVAGLDSMGRLSLPGGGSCIITALASGELRGGGGEPGPGGVTTWSFDLNTPHPARCMGWVVGPLRRFEKTEVRRGAGRSTLPPWITSLGLSGSAGGALLALSASTTGASAAASGAAAPLPVGPPPGAATAAHFCSRRREGASTQGMMAHHARRSRRMVSDLADWLDTPYPHALHRHVFLPPSVLPCASALTATPTGLCPPSPGASTSLFANPTLDVRWLPGLTLYPDALLTPPGVVDANVTSHRLQAEGVAAVWLAGACGPPSPSDSWLVLGLVGYVGAQYMRGLRGDAEYRLGISRGAEAVARLEEAHPSLAPLWPGETAPPPSSLDALVAGDPTRAHYVVTKAPLVIHMLAQRVGEAAFARALHVLVRRGGGLHCRLLSLATCWDWCAAPGSQCCPRTGVVARVSPRCRRWVPRCRHCRRWGRRARPLPPRPHPRRQPPSPRLKSRRFSPRAPPPPARG